MAEVEGLSFKLPSPEDIRELSISSFGYALPAHHLPFYHRLVCDFLFSYHWLDLADERSHLQDTSLSDSEANSASNAEQANSYTPNKESRDFTDLLGYSKENPLGAWTVRCHLSSEDVVLGTAYAPELAPILKGKRVAVKDCIPVRGMPMYCGTPFKFTPLADATVVSRCLAAGAIIAGKAQCEYMCMSATSNTSSAGAVHNPLAPEYHAGGSSSGSAVLVATGEVDLSIGGDQGGSIRIPSAMTGVVGCKPTHGLVPYTMIDGMYGPYDHVGPISRTVEENALMLNVLAGWDGVDPRPSSLARSKQKENYLVGLKEGVQGMRIGVVQECLTMSSVEKDVKQAVMDTAEFLRQMGAIVESVSLPLYYTGIFIWALSVLPNLVYRLFSSDEKDALLGFDEKGQVCDRLTFLREHLLADSGRWSFQFRVMALVGEWMRIHFPEAPKVGEMHKKRLIASFTSVFSKYDVLLMPTTVCKTKKLLTPLKTVHDFEHASAELLLDHVNSGNGLATNTTPINATGHPALSIPIASAIVGGTGEGQDKAGDIVLPLSVMLVGDYFKEATLYRVAYALEQAHPWHSFTYQDGQAV